MAKHPQRDYLVQLLKSKSVLKQEIYQNTIAWFSIFKEKLNECLEILSHDINDPRVRLRLDEKSDTEAHLYIGSDVLIFSMHTNVFKLSDNDFASKTSYVKDNEENGFCGVIHIYDFLADSYEFNRPNDLGYLIGRVFINRENHFQLEGKGKVAMLYRDFMHDVITPDIVKDIIFRISIYALEFDLLNPPYNTISQVSVYELQTLSNSSTLKTGKRLGFKFKSSGGITA